MGASKRLCKCMVLAALISALLAAAPRVPAQTSQEGIVESDAAAIEQALQSIWSDALVFAAVDIDDKASEWLVSVDQKVVSPFLRLWDFGPMLDDLIEPHGVDLAPSSRSQLLAELRSTYARYVLEVLYDYRLSDRTIRDIRFDLDDSQPNISATVKGPLGFSPRVVFLVQTQTRDITIINMKVATVSYTAWKRNEYQKYSKKGQWDKLVEVLAGKNQTFFKQFCLDSSALDEKTKESFYYEAPIYLVNACLSSR